MVPASRPNAPCLAASLLVSPPAAVSRSIPPFPPSTSEPIPPDAEPHVRCPAAPNAPAEPPDDQAHLIANALLVLDNAVAPGMETSKTSADQHAGEHSCTNRCVSRSRNGGPWASRPYSRPARRPRLPAHPSRRVASSDRRHRVLQHKRGRFGERVERLIMRPFGPPPYPAACIDWLEVFLRSKFAKRTGLVLPPSAV